MAVRKAKGRGPKSTAPSPTVEPVFWDSHVAPFLDRHSVLVVVCLIAIASARIVSTYSELSLTTDEPEHLFAGLEYLSKHVYRSEHPPLARAMIALGPYLDGTRLIDGPQNDKDRVAVIKGTGHVNRTTFLMRLGILPFFWTACVVVYIWTRRFTTNGTGAIAVGLFTLTPPVLAHAGLATTDMALGAWLPAAFLSLLIWAESPTWWNGALLGLTAALSAMSKFTSLGYLPASALLAAILWLAMKRPPRGELSAMVRRRVSTLGLACGVALLSIWGCYGFSYGMVPDRDLFLPAPDFFDAIMAAIGHSQA